MHDGHPLDLDCALSLSAVTAVPAIGFSNPKTKLNKEAYQ
jgi:hypothetical protein